MNETREGYCISPKFGKKLFRSAFLALLPLVAALYHDIWFLKIITGCIFATGVLYHRKQTFGIRRTVDVVTCIVGVTITTFCTVLWAPFWNGFLYMVSLTLSFLTFCSTKELKVPASTWAHMRLHYTGSLTAILSAAGLSSKSLGYSKYFNLCFFDIILISVWALACALLHYWAVLEERLT